MSNRAFHLIDAIQDAVSTRDFILRQTVQSAERYTNGDLADHAVLNIQYDKLFKAHIEVAKAMAAFEVYRDALEKGVVA